MLKENNIGGLQPTELPCFLHLCFDTPSMENKFENCSFCMGCRWSISHRLPATTQRGTTGSDVFSNFALLRLVVCSEVDAGVKAGGLLLSAHPL